MLTGTPGLVLPGCGRARCVFMMKAALLAVAAGLILSACGRVGTGAAPSPSPSSNPGPGFDVIATEKDHTATLRVGQKLELVLHANGGLSNWSTVRSGDTAVLKPVVDPAATAIRGVTLAGFQAVAPGEVEVTAVAAPNCSPGDACPMFVALYTLKVTVTA